MREPLAPPDINPVHCVVCLNLGKLTPATWAVATVSIAYMACDEHADELEAQGLACIKTRRAGGAT